MLDCYHALSSMRCAQTECWYVTVRVVAVPRTIGLTVSASRGATFGRVHPSPFELLS